MKKVIEIIGYVIQILTFLISFFKQFSTSLFKSK